MKTCPDKDHAGERDLPDSEYYLADNADGLSGYCITCTKRHAATDQKRRREARKQQGLPVDERAYRRMIINKRLALRAS